jgi:DNA-binding NtrC family response regulator
MADILIVDDEAILAQHYGRSLALAGHEVRQASSGASALRAYRERRPDLTLLDLRLPDMTGFDIMAELREERPVVIMISGHGDVPLAVRAVQEGAENFLTKPVELSQLQIAVERALETVRVRQLSRYLTERRTVTGRVPLGSSPRMQELAAHVDLLASSDRTPVLVTGESGTGKARIAELIHAGSARAHGPFVEGHCAAPDDAVLDAQLFGSDDRASATSHPGLVELAVTGTLFLDDVADLPLSLQPRLLRLLEGRSLHHTTVARDVAVDVRIVAATTRDLVAEVDAGRFREDLYYALSVMPLALPPLRARSREDVAELIARLMEELTPELPLAPRGVAEDALECLLRYPWPGNIRELRNVIERAMILGRGHDTIDVTFLPEEVRTRQREPGHRAADVRTMVQVEREHIGRTLVAHEGNRTHAARALGISRATLIKKIREYGLGGQKDPAGTVPPQAAK